MTEFQVNDPVHVEREGHQQLEGVVAYVGNVQFAEGGDWIGVRLTGSSVGLGKNDGTVKGETYFTCGPNTGVFVRKNHVKRRHLTRLEELRLKRELEGGGGGGGSSSTNTNTSPRPTSTISSARRTTPTPRSPPTGTAARRSTTPSSSSRTPTSTTKAKSRLDEIRERRAALAQQRTSIAPTSKSTTTTTTSPPRDSATKAQSPTKEEAAASPSPEQQEKISALQQQLDDLTKRFQTKEEENAGLQQALSKAEQSIHDVTKKLEKQQQAVSRAEATETSEETVEVLQDRLSSLQHENQTIQDQLEEMQRQHSALEKELQQERVGRGNDVEQLTSTRAELSALQHELQARSDKTAQRASSDAALYKEQAKLQAQLGALTRKLEELEREKMESDTTLEELTLDKEQLQEEKEALQDRLEELKIDAETAQMEVEELRLELEDSKAAAESAAVGAVSASGEGSAEADDMAQALSVQNARLREALIRLREQSSSEKMELSRQMRAAEKDAAAGRALSEEVETLRSSKKLLEEQIADLKDMVEQGSAFESMVESLSDRVMLLEDDNVALQTTIREMEEAADIAAEMEEVQADENKALMRDLESRDAIIRNLEEAIKMQRRREEDFQQTVVKYRKSVETLKQEKSALIDLQQGGEGEKSDLLTTSQKALARAAQLVSDAARARKRDADAAFDRIEADVNRHLSDRLESLLPQSVAASEVTSMKGESLVCSVVGKGGRLLDGVTAVFDAVIRSGSSETLATEVEDYKAADFSEQAYSLSDETVETIKTMTHLTEFALSTVDGNVELLRLLAAGQWPDLLTAEQSAVLGTLVGHSISDLDAAFGSHLKLLKEEGALSPHRTNLAVFRQDIQRTFESINTAIGAQEDLPLAADWKPPALDLFKSMSGMRFALLGVAAMVASIANSEKDSKSSVIGIAAKLDQLNAEVARSCRRLSQIDAVGNGKLVTDASPLVNSIKEASYKLLSDSGEAFTSKEEYVGKVMMTLEADIASIIGQLVQFSSLLRAAGLNSDEVDSPHALSPEVRDPWLSITLFAKQVRAVDGDQDDINYLLRARALEASLAAAVENKPKLALSNAKIQSLEKSLSSRSKEIAMQNARLGELEKLLAKSSSQPAKQKTKSVELSTAEEISVLKEENKVLTEAIDVLQRQVDEYEQSMRSFTSPKGAQRSRRSSGLLTPDLTSPRSASLDGSQPATATSGLEAALFRPALVSARQDASFWRGRTVSNIAISLPPLEPLGASDDLIMAMSTLSSARSYARMKKASVSIVDLSSTDQSAKLSLMAMKADVASAQQALRDATIAATQQLTRIAAV